MFVHSPWHWLDLLHKPARHQLNGRNHAFSSVWQFSSSVRNISVQCQFVSLVHLFLPIDSISVLINVLFQRCIPPSFLPPSTAEEKRLLQFVSAAPTCPPGRVSSDAVWVLEVIDVGDSTQTFIYLFIFIFFFIKTKRQTSKWRLSHQLVPWWRL